MNPLKITIADVPLFFDNKCIEEHLKKKFDLEFVLEIQYQYERAADIQYESSRCFLLILN